MNSTMTAITDIYELSPMQQGMLFHTLYSPDAAVYFEQRHCVIESPLNPASFRQAWQQVVERYAVLRTAFYWEELEKPLQVVRSTAELPWATLDWQNLSSTEQAEQLTRLLERDRRQGFDLQQAPLMRCTLIQLATNRYQFIWSHHHLLMDGWCNGILLQDVLAGYEALCQGRSRSLPAAPAYRDYILWLQQQDSAQAEAYWGKCLAGFTQPIQLGGDRAADRGHVPHAATLSLSIEFTSQIQTFTRQHRLTLNTVVQVAWAIWLHRYSGLSDVVFGVTVAGRPPQLPNVETIVGLFINTLPLRVQLEAETQVLTILQQVQAQQVDHTQYEFSALSQIQSWSEVPARMPLFESVVVFENYPISTQAIVEVAHSQLQISEVQGFAQTNYPLVLSVLPGAELRLQLDYDPVCLEPLLGDRVLAQLQILLNQMVDDPAQPLAEMTLLTPTQRDQILLASRGTLQEFPTELIHHRFEQQVQRSPHTVAVIHADQSLTYADLNQRANQLAHYLRSRGVQPETRVGICLERSVDLIISLLAVLKAGGAYVPLDPSLPGQRLAYLVEDAQVAVRIDREMLVAAQAAIAACPITNPTAINQPHHLAYLIYTSGSTGLPKGVMIEHHSLTNFVNAAIEHYQLTDRDRVLQFASISFDAAIEEIYPCLVAGGTLILRTEDMLSPTAFWRACHDWQLTVVDLPTAYWHQLVASLTQINCPDCLRLVIIGGEAAQPDRVQTWQQTFGQVPQLINTYGPTEATVVTTIAPLTQPITGSVPIGRAIANVSTYVLDDQLQPVEIGMTGELYIGGAGVARGYWNRLELTAERFIPHPKSLSLGRGTLNFVPPSPVGRGTLERIMPPSPVGRGAGGEDTLYRTGDRVCQLPDGNLEFLGRVDDQIKLRGYRIELNEIAAQLQQHSAVSQAIAILRHEAENPQLVAYFTAHPPTPPSLLDDLRQFIRDRLPAYMVPSAFVELAQFPLSPTGKLDRAALPDPAPVSDRPQLSLRSPTADLLTLIWQQVLHQNRVEPDDSFFELGGHSLLAMQMISQIQQTFQIELPLRSLFEAPTIAQLSSVIDAARFSQASFLSVIEPCDLHQPLSLSFAQQRLWFLAQLEPDSAAYLVPAAIRLTGELDIACLQHSWAIVVQRHESLRTAIQTVDGQPVLHILPEVSTSIPLVDLTPIPTDQQAAWVQTLIQQEMHLSLDCVPLWRVKLLRLSESEFVLSLIFHHTIIDGWSLEILGRELALSYQALRQSAQPVLPSLPIQYADFAAWQRQWLQGDPHQRDPQGDRWQQQLTYWQQHLANAPPLLELPTDRPRPAVQTFRGSRQRFQLSPALSRSLQTLGQQHNATLFMTVLATFNILLYRLTQQPDLVIGTPIANRHYPGVDSLIGFFANTLALRTSLAGNPTFEQVLAQVRNTVLNAYAHQDLPFEQWVEALDLERSLSYSPIFQVLLVVEPAPVQPLDLSGLAWEPLPIDSGTAKVDLTLMLTETADGLSGQWEYNTDLFDAATIARWSQHWQTLLEQIILDSTQPLSALSILTASERQTILHTWNQTQRPYPQHSVVTEFEQQVTHTPDAIALVCNSQSLTYRELNQQANQLAHHLQDLGVGQETPVALVLERSLAAIVAILAILKAGAVYLPIDPGNPRDRVQFLLDDAQVEWVITTTSQVDAIAKPGRTAIDYDQQAAQWQHQSSANLNLEIHPDQLAYILYTSGSTGLPKGVCTPHRGIVRLVKPCEFVEISVGDRLLHAASLAFDAATFEIWATLLNGAILVIMNQALPTLTELADIIQTQQITTLWLTAGLFHLMVEEQLASFSPVRQLIAGGDVISSQHVKTLLETHSHCRVINGYGPTEGTTFTCCHAIAPTDLALASPPIGRPIQNTQVYVLDSDLQPVPVGVPGELYIGGAGLARGYLNRPDLTAERFVPNSFAAERSPLAPLVKGGTRIEVPLTKGDLGGSSQGILYKTGDRVCWRPDGSLIYLGRSDDQVKIRGFRVELGEIAIALNQSPQITQAVVIHHRQNPDQSCLVAYYTPATVSAATLRTFLQTRLPSYLIPAHFIGLDSLPLTVNGKLDRRILPTPDLGNLSNGAIAPTTDLEHLLVQIWQTVLNLDTLSLTDNFFELGGDSIRAIQLVSRVNQAGWQLTPKQLFQFPTIAELSAVITPLTSTAVEPAIITGIAPLSPIQHWFLEQSLPHPHHFNQAVWLEVLSPWECDRLHLALRFLLQHHDALRLRLSPTDAGWQQDIMPPSDRVPLTWLDFSALTELQQHRHMQQSANQMQASLNLATGELVRVAYFDLGDRPHRLLVVIHHWAIDGISWRILLEDLQTLDHQLRQGYPPQLPPKTTSFQRWTERLHTVANQPDLLAESDYWQSVVRRAAPPLPVDYPNGSNQVGVAASIRLTLTPKQTDTLLHVVPAAYNTQIIEVLLGAIAQGFQAWTGDSTVCIDLESYGRTADFAEDLNLSRTVGWFTSLFPVGLTLPTDPHPGAVLSAIKAQLRAVPQQGVGYGILHYLTAESESDFLANSLASPAEISVNYLGQFDLESGDRPATLRVMPTANPGETQHPANCRSHRLEITGAVQAEQLYLEWHYSKQQYESTTIATLAHHCMQALESLIAHCQTLDAPVYTPSDFDLTSFDLALDQTQLDQILASVNFAQGNAP